MKYPKLVQPFTCTTAVTVTLTGDNGEQGEPTVAKVIKTLCNQQTSVHNVHQNDRYVQKQKTTLLFDGPLAETDAQLKGYVQFAVDCKVNIISGFMARNPDGSVNYTKLELE